MGHKRGLCLGVDTGGTYTDAVLYDETALEIVAKAKSPTTHEDLSVGITAAIDVALATASLQAATAPALVGMVALSTTLATNALVEGTGRPACLVVIGFDNGALERGGLREAIGNDPVVFVSGGHSSHGDELVPLDVENLAARIDEVADEVDAFAVTAQFATRNADHEERARKLIVERTGKPVTCSHHLSTRLNGPRRAITVLLNARLISLIEELVVATATSLRARGICAPLMVVRGNGSLASAEFVRWHPVETILSGPAASIVGAAHLLGVEDALISDIGGTTTDIAVVRDGRPEISLDGAVVGGHHTMIEAVRTYTHGLGGDSEVDLADRADGARLEIGPRRVVPLSFQALTHLDMIMDCLIRQLNNDAPGAYDGRFVQCTQQVRLAGLDEHERRIVDSIGECLVPVDRIVTSARAERALRRVASRAMVRLSSFTPTDAAHVLGLQETFVVEPARLAAELLARRRDRFGRAIADSATEISRVVIDTLVRRTAEAVLTASFDHDGLRVDAASSQLVAAALDRVTRSSRVDVGLAVALVGLGAPAPIYGSRVAELLRSEVLIPDHADVANAIGAAVGKIRVQTEVEVTCPRRGVYRIHAGAAPETFWERPDAEARALELAHTAVIGKAEMAGATEVDVRTEWLERTVEVQGRPMFVKGLAFAEAWGRPNPAKLTQ